MLARLCLEQGRPGEAGDYLRGALHAFRRAGAPQGVYRALLGLAECAAAAGEADEGLDLFVQAGQCEGAVGEGGEEARVLGAVCEAFAAAGRTQDALEGYRLLRQVLERHGDRAGLIALLDTVGGLYFQLGEQAESTRCYEESLLLKSAVPQT